MPDPIKVLKAPTLEELELSAKAGLVRVYNKTPRTFIHGKYRAPAGSFGLVPQVLADFWTGTLVDQVIEAAVATRELGGANARIADLQGQIAALTKENADLKALPRDGRTQKAFSDLNTQISTLSALVAEKDKEIADLTEKLTSPTKPGADSV